MAICCWTEKCQAGGRRLQNEIEQLKALLERKYKKRCQHLAGGKKSPCSTVDALLCHRTVNNTIRRRLLLQESIIEDIRNKYQNTKKEREKQITVKTTSGKFIQKYRLQRAAQATGLFKETRKKPVSVENSQELTVHGQHPVQPRSVSNKKS